MTQLDFDQWCEKNDWGKNRLSEYFYDTPLNVYYTTIHNGWSIEYKDTLMINETKSYFLCVKNGRRFMFVIDGLFCINPSLIEKLLFSKIDKIYE